VSVLDKLASALNRRDEVPNQEMARSIVRGRNAAAVKELVENLDHKNRAIRISTKNRKRNVWQKSSRN
jgi:hypothetical protein